MMFSAKSFLVPAQELNRLLKEVAHDEKFAKELKKAAELNQNDRVVELIQSKGVKTKFEIRFTPDGIRIEFQPEDIEACFFILLSLCW
jgi:hypothetical protein